jgi:ribosomal protein L24E
VLMVMLPRRRGSRHRPCGRRCPRVFRPGRPRRRLPWTRSSSGARSSGMYRDRCEQVVRDGYPEFSLTT